MNTQNKYDELIALLRTPGASAEEVSQLTGGFAHMTDTQLATLFRHPNNIYSETHHKLVCEAFARLLESRNTPNNTQ